MSASIASPAAQCRSYAPGARIRVRDEEWLVRLSQPIGHGHYAIRCVGVSELVQGYEAVFMTDIDKAIAPVRVDTTELVRDTSAQFRRSKLYLESMLRRTPPAGADIAIGHRAAMKPSPFQLVPAAQALGAQRPRILIADGVGLGKTLEVGVLLAELIARGRGERILVVVMKSMLAQFQKELWTRFTIPLVRLDSVGLKRVHYKIPTGKNPFHYYKRAIISIDTLKNERQYRSWLEKCHWDAVVIDECHNVVNTNTGRNRVAKLPVDHQRRAHPHFRHTAQRPARIVRHPHESCSTRPRWPTCTTTALRMCKACTCGASRRTLSRRWQLTSLSATSMWLGAQPPTPRKPSSAAIEKASFNTLDRRVKLTAHGRARDMLFKTGLLKAFLSSPRPCRRRPKQGSRASICASPRAPATRRGCARILPRSRASTSWQRQVGVERFSKLQHLFEELLPALGIRGRATDPRLVLFSERLATLELLRELLCERLGLETCKESAGRWVPRGAHRAPSPTCAFRRSWSRLGRATASG